MMVSIQNMRPCDCSISSLFKNILGWFIGSDARILRTLHRNCGKRIFPLYVFSCSFATFPCLIQHHYKDSYQPSMPYPHYHSNHPRLPKMKGFKFWLRFRCELLSSRSSRLLPTCTGSDKSMSQIFFANLWGNKTCTQ